MDDRDVYLLCACIAGLAGIALLHGRMIAMISERTLKNAADVEFLLDHTVVRETEARP